MPERARPLNLGFSVADAEYPTFTLRDGSLVLDFIDWREVQVRLLFTNAAGVKWQELDSRGPEDRNDDSYEIENSAWVQEYLTSGAREPADHLRHFKLCFNAAGVLEVLASDIEMTSLDGSEVTVMRGTFLYDGAIVCSVRIVKTQFRPGSGDHEDPPQWADDQVGEFFRVDYGSTTNQEVYNASTGYFASLTAAIAAAETAPGIGPTVRWTE